MIRVFKSSIFHLQNCPAPGWGSHSSHTSRQVVWPQGMSPLPLPVYSPELNPLEQLFRQLKAQLANQLFDNLESLEQALSQALSPYWKQPQLLQRLTAYPWWQRGLLSIQTSL